MSKTSADVRVIGLERRGEVAPMAHDRVMSYACKGLYGSAGLEHRCHCGLVKLPHRMLRKIDK